MKTPIRKYDVVRPERIMGNLLNDYISGEFDGSNVIYRVLVVKIDTIGGQLEGPDSIIEGRKDDTQVPNPKNSILGRIVSYGIDRATEDSDLQCFWPFFPYDTMPIKEGENAYIWYEDNINKRHRNVANKSTRK